MTDDNAVLMVRLIAALRGLFLVSQGATQSFNARTTGTKEHHGPAGDSKPEYDHFADRFAKEGISRELVEEAEEALANWKRQPEPKDREYARGTLAWKRRVANDERDISEVCRIYSLSRWQVYGIQSRYRDSVS